MTLPDYVREIAEFSPVEDVILPIVRDRLPGLRVQSLIDFQQEFPAVVIRRSAQGLAADIGDPRFVDSALIAVSVFVEGVNGDEEGAVLSEAVRVILREAKELQTVVPGLGHICYFDQRTPPKRTPDWATSVGPVQYADLPTGITRYEATYQLGIRRPFSRPITTTNGVTGGP
jgi:hypothetical protein